MRRRDEALWPGGEWRTFRLGDVVTRLTNGYVGPTRDIYQDEGVPYLLARHVKSNQLTFDGKTFVTQAFNAKNKKSILRAGDVLLVQSGHVGHSAVVPPAHEGHNCHAMIVISPMEERILGGFLSFFFESPSMQLEFEKIHTGATLKHLNCGDVKELHVPIPPLSQQQRIVAILNKAFEGIATAKANAETNLQNARELFQSQLQSVFAQKGSGWSQKPLSDLCQLITKGSSPNWQGIAYIDEPGVLFVTSENVGEYRLLMEKRKYVDERFNLKDKKSILRNGDVLTNIVGASIGRTAIFDLDEIANINQAVCLIRCEPALLDNFYLTYLLNSPLFRQVLHDNEVDNARANLSLGFFSRLAVPSPPIQSQREIVSELDGFHREIRRLESIYQQKLTALDELKKSLLHQAFSGQL